MCASLSILRCVCVCVSIVCEQSQWAYFVQLLCMDELLLLLLLFFVAIYFNRFVSFFSLAQRVISCALFLC